MIKVTAEEEKKPEKKDFVVHFLMAFFAKYQVIGLAGAMIIGAAATKMVISVMKKLYHHAHYRGNH